MSLFFSVDAFADATGNSLCATCHRTESAAQPATAMAHAMQTPDRCDVLQSHPFLTFRKGQFTYKIETHDTRTTYSVSDGNSTFSVAIVWALGLGEAGQTYVFEKDGSLYESRVSYFRAIDGLDLTLGFQNLLPLNIVQAAGREMGKRDAAQCLNCHSTNGVHGFTIDFAAIRPGIQCERCHEGAGEHASSFSGNKSSVQMEKLGAKTTDQLSDFCGQCHRTWQEIALSGKLGISNVRFQPYRLTNSKCYSAADARIRCTACHNPHGELDRVAANYDSKCQACHSGGAAHRICSVAKSNCASCHMPQLEIPGSHFRFTDHQIRIVKANEKYPD
jgi:hypothetical protein